MFRDIQSFVQEMPLKYYFNGGFFSSKASKISFYIDANQIQALVSYDRRSIGFEPELHRDADAPPTFSEGQGYKPAATGRKVSNKLAARYHVPQRFQHCFVVDALPEQLFVNLFSLERLRRQTVSETLAELRQAPGQILSGWDRDDFRWHIVDNTLSLSGDPKPTLEETILLIGLSESTAAVLELWSQEQGAAVSAILPLPLAVLAWANEVLPTARKHSVILVAGESSVVVGVIKDRRLTNLLTETTIERALASVRRNATEFALEAATTYLWYSKEPDLSDDELTQEGLIIIDEEHLKATLGEPLILSQSTGKRTVHDGPIPHLLHWITQQ